jgi:hypothetical protein
VGVGVQVTGVDVADEQGAKSAQGGDGFFVARTDISLEDALHSVGIKAFEILGLGSGSDEVMVIVAVSQAQQSSQVDRSQGLHPDLKSTDQGSQAGISVDEGLVEALTEAGMPWAPRQGLVVGGVDEQLSFLALWGVTAGKGQAAVAVEDLEVFSEQMDTNGRTCGCQPPCV